MENLQEQPQKHPSQPSSDALHTPVENPVEVPAESEVKLEAEAIEPQAVADEAKARTHAVEAQAAFPEAYAAAAGESLPGEAGKKLQALAARARETFTSLLARLNISAKPTAPEATEGQATGKLAAAIGEAAPPSEGVPLEIMSSLPMEGKSEAYLAAREQHIMDAAEHANLYKRIVIKHLPTPKAEQRHFQALRQRLAREKGDTRPTFWQTFEEEIDEQERDAIGKAVASQVDALQEERWETRKTAIASLNTPEAEQAYQTARTQHVEAAARLKTLLEMEELELPMQEVEKNMLDVLRHDLQVGLSDDSRDTFWQANAHLITEKDQEAIPEEIELRARAMRAENFWGEPEGKEGEHQKGGHQADGSQSFEQPAAE